MKHRAINCTGNVASQMCVRINQFNQWRLLRGRCQGSSSVCTPAVSGLHLSDCPCCGNGPGWPGAWMRAAPPIPLWRCRGPAHCQGAGSRAAGSPGWGSRGRTFASWPSERPWCSAGCRSAVSRGKAVRCFQRQKRQNMQRFQRQPWLGQPFWFCGAESPSLCGECPGIRGFACSGQSQCRPTFKEKPRVHRPKAHRWICLWRFSFIQVIVINLTLDTGEYSWEGLGQGLLFTVDGWVFPTGLPNKNPVLHFIYR